MGLFDWLFGKKAAAPSRSGTYAIKAPRSNPRRKKMRNNPWKPCDDPAVKLRRPSEYMGAEFSLKRGRRKGKFEIVGCGVAPTKIRNYGGVRTGLYAAKYEDGQIRYLPKNWVASTYSRVQRAEAAKAEGVVPKSRKKGKKGKKATAKPRKSAKSAKVSKTIGRGCKKVTFKPAGKKQVSFTACPTGVRTFQLGANQFQGMLGLPAPRKSKKATSRKPKKAAPKKATSRKPKKGTTSGMVRMVEQFRALAAAARGRKAAAAAKPKKAVSRKPKKAAPKKSRARRSAPKPMTMSMPGILRRPIGFSARPARQPGGGVIFAPGGVEVIPASMINGMGGGRTSSSPRVSSSMAARSMGGAPSPFLLGPGSPAKKASRKRPKKAAVQPMLPLANPSRRRMNSWY